MRPRVRALFLLACAALALSMVASTTTTAASAATLSPGASTSHPFSSPVWFPLRDASKMDCYKNNPGGCGGTHPTYLWDIIGENGVNNQPVYAMGAGIVHIGAKGTGCGHAQSRGDYLYIDHGHGTLTYYGHLGHMLVHNGQYVTARTAIAYVGNSGYARCHTYPKLRYLMVARKSGGTAGKYVEITHTYACLPGHKSSVQWPRDLSGTSATHWNAVRRNVPIPATTRSCIPSTPATANRPTKVHLVRASATSLRASWARAAASGHVTEVSADLSEYHPSIKRWLVLRSHSLSSKSTGSTFTKLPKGKSFRVQIMFANGTGWSAPCAYVYRTLPR